MLAYVATLAIYNVTEAGFRILMPTWIFFLLVFVGSRRIASSMSNGETKIAGDSVNRRIKPSTDQELASVS